MANVVNAKDELDLIVTCPVHYQVHICRGGRSCILTEDGTCCVTGKTYDDLVRTDAIGVDGLPDFCSNGLGLHRSEASSKPEQATQVMDQESFIASVHEGVTSVDRRSLEDHPLSGYMRELLAKIYSIMHYNYTIQKTANVTPCNVWVESTIQVLRKLQGKDLIPDMTSKPEVKAIVLETLQSLEPAKKIWWAKKACITERWCQ